METLKIYTDGGCSGNQSDSNVGGWGAILEFRDARKEIYGGELNTTNNRMEMTALINAFQSLKKENLKIEVFSDSSYLMDCFRQGWYKNWQKNGWLTAGKKPVENKELWLQLIPFVEKNEISFYRVKGHINLNSPNTDLDKHFNKFVEWNGSKFGFDDFLYVVYQNNRADELANIGIDETR